MNKIRHFHFPKLPDSQRLEFEKLSQENAGQILELFSQDPNEFIIPEFKEEKYWKKYVDWQLNLAPFSPKHGAQDWLIKLKETGEYVGLLHLYELSLETFMQNHQRCHVGIVMKSNQRRKYLASEALSGLMNYAFGEMERNLIIARTEHANSASQKMLLSLGFQDVSENYSREFRCFERVMGKE